MRIGIAGAGAVGRSVARELLDGGHRVLLIERQVSHYQPQAVPAAEWLLADACELTALHEAGLETCDVVVGATGDDKVNLVVSLLAKTEFGVPRTVGRVNHPRNEWMFNDVWGVDVSVSTPRLMSALVEEAVTVGDLVRLFTFQRGQANLVELTLPHESPCVGKRVRDVQLPGDGVLVAIVRDGQARAPERDAALEGGDELLFVISPDYERDLTQVLSPH